MHRWVTPDGDLDARIYEIYVGLRGQWRLGLVDAEGRVHHYDADEVVIWGSWRWLGLAGAERVR